MKKAKEKIPLRWEVPDTRDGGQCAFLNSQCAAHPAPAFIFLHYELSLEVKI